jgi:hypothetical protein
MTTTTSDDPRANLIGAWILQSYEAHSIDGQGLIMYAPDGYMALDAARANALTGTWG